ncbi:hypothetical protein BGP75_06410 [Motiliproteus sp. MSK22-1]|nr:hypothetical protein BGP75_06410 [Motiliproteus sp. MSK22-1]
MGTVYKGFDTIIERWVAIKVLHPHLLEGEGGEDLAKRFKQEAQAAARCLHPNIVTVFDYGIEQDTPYIVMEYVEGVELKESIKNQGIDSVVQAVRILLQVLSALEVAHAKGVVHRDIKPANIILLPDGQVKVSDFGVARLDSSDLTSAGFMVGTPNYMSPEGLRGFKVDNRSDLYSAALLLLEMVTHSKPYAGRNTEELLDALNLQTRLEPLLRRDLQSVIRRALETDPSHRFQTAALFSKALGGLIETRQEDQDDQKTMVIPAAAYPGDSEPGYQLSQSQASNWNPDLLKVIEQSLVKYIGPMASVLIRKNSRTISGVSELSQKLAEQIPSVDDRQQFLKQLNKTGIYEQAISGLQPSYSTSAIQSAESGLKSSASYVGTPDKSITAEDIEKVSKKLLVHVGPLAPRIVKMAAKNCAELPQLIEKVSSHIPDDSERLSFKKSFE